MRYYLCIFLVTLGLMLPGLGFTNQNSTHVKVNLIQEEETIQPNRPFWVAIRLEIEEGWHVYWKNPGDAGIPVKVNWKLPEGFQVNSLQWPFPEKFDLEKLVGFGYEKEVVFLAQLTPPATFTSGTELPLQAQIHWLVCSPGNCQPGSTSVNLTVKVEDTTPHLNPQYESLFSKAWEKLPKFYSDIKTIHKEGIVQLQLPVADIYEQDSNEFYFFPEQNNMIDHTIEPVVAMNDNPTTNYIINLKGSDTIGVKSNQNLKGVLVVQNKGDGRVQAFDIDSPIYNQTGQELANFVSEPSNAFSVGSSLVKPNPSSVAANAFNGSLSLAILFAFIGGIILNLMPCVLPVMSFKVMSFVKMAGQSRTLTMKHGLTFSLGVLISFWALAGGMLLLRAYGQSVGWGFQLQQPVFVIILASILFIFSLSLFGVFEWGVGIASWAGQTESDTAQQSSSYLSSFLSGVLATAVATPCTGPFLGSAVGFAVTLPVFQALLIFTALGMGMCFPYLLLASFPAWLRFIPKPGAWMETFKQLTGFLLLATVLWLLWVFSAQTNTFSLICLLAGFLCFSIGAWLYGRMHFSLISKTKRVIVYASILLAVGIGCQLILYPRASWNTSETTLSQGQEGAKGWETFSPERVVALQQAGKPVLIDFTAKWCLICQANHLALTNEAVEQKLDEAGVIKMKADWTKNDPVITAELSKFGRNSVPLYVLYGTKPGQEPIILPQILTPDIVIEHLASLNSSSSTEEIALRDPL